MNRPKLKDLSKLPDQMHDRISNELRGDVDRILKDKGVAGYAVVVWFIDGSHNQGSWAARGPIGKYMMPTLVHDFLARRMAEVSVEEDLEADGRLLPK